MAKNVASEDAVEAPVVEDAPIEVVAELAAVGVPPVAAKRVLGAKEPIVFKWKVVGTAQGTVVTLYKSVEREEADGHAERLGKEGYYRDVRVLEASATIVQQTTKPAKKAEQRSELPAKAAAKAAEGGGKKPARAVAVPKRPAPKKTGKTRAKTAKKKPASTPPKRAGKAR